MSRLAIYGAGGFAAEMLCVARADGREIIFVSDSPAEPVLGYPVIGPEQLRDDDEVVIAIADGAARARIASRLRQQATSLFAPTAVIGPGVEVGEGAIFCDHAMVTARARIGRHFHCNAYSYVAHDCEIGDFVTFAPKVCCNGNMRIGDGAYIGAGSVLRNGTPGKPLVVGADAVVGCGAVVTQDVPPGATVIGNPAREIGQPLSQGYFSTTEIRELGFAFVGEGVQIARTSTVVGAENISLRDHARIDGYCTIIGTGPLHIGRYVHIHANVVIGSRGGVFIDDFVGISHGCNLLSASDDFTGRNMTNSNLPEGFTKPSIAPIHIGKHVPIGAGCTILPGVRIGDGAAICAHSVVSSDMPEWMMCSGSPARARVRRRNNVLELAARIPAPGWEET